ncbi:VOC family protein [Parvibaculum sp.]|uniref:VOC family protein n=1 Tax=Parvibaculum sp. TaxID=2024848 RepID=UPI001B28693E|nr:VOC family protein [Parvibaculum sp.]MBO6633417.1 VOC family protein [Parvibaculum sp.]MBO6679354.1 VOC family protein [Parvibaculum sp.]MBO6684622.1 VOC family protein [Parvibaculum sp.]MBO6904534.1 VOC family protein [Parvibaculum sp.]
MYDHIELKVKDLGKAAAFYEATLKPLGAKLCYDDPAMKGFGAKTPGLYLAKGTGKGIHLAFAAPSRAAVDRFHEAGLKAGGKDNGKPGIRADYAPTYYAAFLIDPDGNNVEAVCLK